MRKRPSARLLVFNERDEVLLFRSAYTDDPLMGQNYWFTPGGAVEPGETFEQAGMRELQEETGLKCDQLGLEVGRRTFVLKLTDGEQVEANERYYVVRPETAQLSFASWTDEEVAVIIRHKWWSLSEISDATETIWPENLKEMLTRPEVQASSNARKAVNIASEFLTNRSSQEYSEGFAMIGTDGIWHCWFERRSRPIIDPFHVRVWVDLVTGLCEVPPQL